MESFSQNIESKTQSIDMPSFDEQEYKIQAEEIQNDKDEDKKQRDRELNAKKFELSDKKEKVEDFVRNNCCEPIAGINNIIPFKDLVDTLVKWAEDEWKAEVKKSILEGNAKDKRIYELKAYKKLLHNGFILPSDNRSYKNEQYHLWVDYTIQAWADVRSIYNWKVIASWLDWWLWHRVIIEHSMPDWTKFYSLYAHLWSWMLPEVGKNIKPWDIIWKVWQAFTPENWDWEEHLHFQIMENPDSPKWYSQIKWELNYDVLKSFGKE